MKHKTIITLSEIHSFYKEKCAEEGNVYSKKKFEQFLNCCEIDFFQWLNENFNFYENSQKEITNTLL